MKIEEVFKHLRNGHKMSVDHWGDNCYIYEKDGRILNQSDSPFNFGHIAMDGAWYIVRPSGFYTDGIDVYFYDTLVWAKVHVQSPKLECPSEFYNHVEILQSSLPENLTLLKETVVHESYDDYEAFISVRKRGDRNDVHGMGLNY